MLAVEPMELLSMTAGAVVLAAALGLCRLAMGRRSSSGAQHALLSEGRKLSGPSRGRPGHSSRVESKAASSSGGVYGRLPGAEEEEDDEEEQQEEGWAEERQEGFVLQKHRDQAREMLHDPEADGAIEAVAEPEEVEDQGTSKRAAPPCPENKVLMPAGAGRSTSGPRFVYHK